MNLVESDEDDVDDDGDHDAQRSSDKLVSITPGLIRALDLVDDDDVDSNDGDDAVVVPKQQHDIVQITPGLIRELSLLNLAPDDDDDKEETTDEAAACCTRSPSPLSFTTDHNNSSAYETSIDEGCGLVSAVDVLRALRDQYANMTDDDNDSATTITTTTAATPPLFPSPPPHHCSNQSEDLLFDNKENDTKMMENMHNNRAVTSLSCPPHLAKTRPLRVLQVKSACRRSLFDDDDDGDHDAQRSSDKLVSITPGLIRALDLVDDDDVDSNDGDDAVVVPQQQHNLVQITPGLIRALNLAPDDDDDDKEETTDEAAACCTRSPSPLSFTTDHNNSSAYETSIDEGCGLVSAVDVLRALRDQYANMTDDDNDSATTITTTTAATPPLFPSPPPHHSSNHQDLFSIIRSLEDLLLRGPFDNKENDTKIMENTHSDDRAVTSLSCPPHLAKTRPLRVLQVEGACRRSLFDDDEDSGGGTTITTPKDSVRYLSRIGKHHKPPLPPPSSSTFSSFNHRQHADDRSAG
ncbi:hypothetical protein NFJ02_30g77910 [Pycnococcus provasolii]